MAAKPTGLKTPTSQSMNSKVLLYSLLLTLQYGAQPLITKRCIRREVIVTSSVLACEVAKVICALFLIAREGGFKRIFKEWTLIGSLMASGLPAAVYALQNSLLQISYKNLDSLTFSILNQTKLFFTALFTFIILGQRQTIQQIGALLLLIMAAVLLSIGEGSSKGSSSDDPDLILFYGIIPVMVASILSGLASSLCQWASQIPVVVNAFGGILVGLVIVAVSGRVLSLFPLFLSLPCCNFCSTENHHHCTALWLLRLWLVALQFTRNIRIALRKRSYSFLRLATRVVYTSHYINFQNAHSVLRSCGRCEILLEVYK